MARAKRATDAGVMARVLLLPVRHHSPRAAAFVAAELARVKPRRVLVEGPSDASDLIGVIADASTRPPVAVLGYRTDGITQSALWPFADYSPELVALRWAVAHGAEARFIDVPVGVALATLRAQPVLEVHESDDESFDSDERSSLDASTDPDPDFAARVGMRSFDEAWDALIEAPAHGADDVRAILLAYAELIRAAAPRDALRDAVMARAIIDAARDVPPESIAVVVGAAHAAAFVAGDFDLAAAASLPAPVASAVTVIPYSFPRLAEQLGYGAGNRAPRYFQRAHEAGCDLGRATLETLVDVGEHLRLRGFAVSLADTLEAWRLAQMLAQIRGKTAPALDEAREAAIATLGRGDAGAVDAAFGPSTIGRAVGRVAAKLGPNALTDEFWREVRARRLPASDEAEDFALVLNDPVQVATSVFLHRLRLADVPYASWLGAGRGAARGPDLEPEGLASLGRIREAWTAQWTPATDVALIERIVQGSSLEEVCARVLDTRLAAARTTGACAEVLLDAVIARCAVATTRALVACDERAATDEDVPSLARAAVALSSLASYGTTRADAIAGDAVARLLATTFERAVLRAPAAAETDSQGAGEIARALRALHEVAMAWPPSSVTTTTPTIAHGRERARDASAMVLVAREDWLDAARAIADRPRSAPRLAGLALGLRYLGGAITDDDVATALALRLAPANPPEHAAEQLCGFVEVNALVVVKSRAVVGALDRFLTAIPDDRLVDVLPVLRRALGALGAVERRYLLDNVIAVRGLGASARAAAAVVDQHDTDALKAMQDDLGAALDDLDDLL